MRLQWKDLTKQFGGRTILHGLSGGIDSGEVLVVAGANGSGKTTLLRMLAGLTRPTHGRAFLTNGGGGERDVRDCAGEIGFVTPDLALYGELTALENLQFFSRARGLQHSADELIARLAAVGLGGHDRSEAGAFSSGMKQRLKLAFATLHDPRVLLLDEPGSNLDEAGGEVVRRIVQAQRQRGLCILATNDERERGYGDRVLQLGDGSDE